MSSIEYNALLLKISRKLDELNISELVFLCREKLRDDNQPNIQDVLSLFKELEDQNYLGIDRLEHLRELLKAVREWALFKQVKKFETKRREYNELLDCICEVLDDSVDLARLINICRLERERDIRDVRTLLKELEVQDNLGIGRLDILKEILKATEEEGLLQKVEEFEKRRDEEDEFDRIRDQTAQIVASARSVGGRVIGVLNMKTICRVAAAGITLVSVQEMLSRWSTYDQLVTCFNACVLPAGTQLINIGQGCVCFTIRAESLTALTSFWDMYLDGTLRQRLHNFFVTDEVLKVAGVEENVEVIVTVDEKEYEKGCFDFLHEAEGKRPPRKWRRNSDSVLFAAPEEVEDGTLVKLKQLENTVHLQEERIKILEQEVENLPQLFHLETGVLSEISKHFADTGKPWEDMVGETESVTSSDSGISEFEIHRESFGSDYHWPETGSRPATLLAVEPAGAVVEVDDIPKLEEFSSKPHIITAGASDDYPPETGSRPATLSPVEPAGVVVEVDDIPKLEEFSSKPHIITAGASDDYPPETGSRPATLSPVEPAGVVVEVDDIPKLEETVTTRHFGVRSGLFRQRKSKGKGRVQTDKGPPSAQATKVADAKAAEHDVKKLKFRLGSGLITAEHTARQMPENGNLRPPKRPGYGTVGRPIKLRANFFRMNMSPRLSDLYHYHVETTPDRCPRMVKRDVVNEIVMKYRSTVFQGHVPAFDGEKNLYSRIKLPSPAEIDVTLLGEDGGKDRVFKVKIQFAASASIESLKKFLMGQQNGKPAQDTVQALDIVMRQIPSKHFTPVGRSFFPLDGYGSKYLGEGCEVQFGFYQSVRPSQWKAMLVNIDVSAKGFYKSQNVLDFVCETLHLSPSQLEDSSVQINKGMLEEAVRGIRIQTTHESLIKRKYTVWGVSGLSADRLQFDVADETSGRLTKTTVAAYFKNRYNIQLRYPHLSCLMAGRNRDHYLPMEVCTIVPCERRHLTEQQIENLIRSTARPAPERRQDIDYWAQEMVRTSQKYLNEEFQTSVDPEMVRVDGRVLPPPKIKLGPQDPALVPRDGSWDMRDKNLHQGAVIDSWALACFAPPHRCNDNQLRNFCKQIASVSNREGMRMADPVVVRYARFTEVESLFSKWLIEYPGLQLIVAVLPGRNRQLYPEIKRVGDSVLGIPTQCVQLKHVQEARGQLCANISLKINAKLGGVNHVVDRSVKSLVFRVPSIIFGAGMSQPSSYECGTPSIAAVVASMDANATKYQARVRAQRHEKGRGAQEIINDLAVIVKELLIEFYKANGKLKPSKIIFYRNGVSEGQFDQVLAHEVRAVQEACMKLEKEYRPGITVIVVQKRHHTRLFCENRGDETGKARNVPPGTTVDSGITHPYEFDFYLCSHFGVQGTSRPTHYHVLYDDNGFDADSLQQLTYQLCHVYARCTKSVSMPAPAYYAHLAAFRARVHVTNGGSSRDAGGVDLEKCSKAIQVSEKMKGVMYFT